MYVLRIIFVVDPDPLMVDSGLGASKKKKFKYIFNDTKSELQKSADANLPTIVRALASDVSSLCRCNCQRFSRSRCLPVAILVLFGLQAYSACIDFMNSYYYIALSLAAKILLVELST